MNMTDMGNMHNNISNDWCSKVTIELSLQQLTTVGT